MESCNTGGSSSIGASQYSSGFESPYLKEIADNTRDMAMFLAGSAKGGDVLRNGSYLAGRVASMRQGASDHYSFMAENHARIYSKMMTQSGFNGLGADIFAKKVRSYASPFKDKNKSINFFRENYLGSKSSQAYREIEGKLSSVGATTSNNMANKLVKMGAALPFISEKIYGMLGESGGQKSWLSNILESTSLASKGVAAQIAGGVHDKEISGILKKYSGDLAGASLAMQKFVQSLNVSSKAVSNLSLGVGKAAFVGLGAIGVAGIRYATSLGLNPNQSGAQALERSTGFYQNLASSIGNATSLAGAAMLYAPNPIAKGIGGALALGGQGLSAGLGWAAQKYGVSTNTGAALSMLGLNAVSSASVGNQIQSAVQTYLSSGASTFASKSLMGFTYGAGRYQSNRNIFGTLAMGDSERSAFYQQLLLSNRLSDSVSASGVASDIRKAGVSGSYYSSVLGSFNYAPGVVSGSQSQRYLANQMIKANRISPLLGSSMHSYENAGFIQKTIDDATAQAIMGDTYENLLSGVTSGKINRGDLLTRLKKSGIPLSVLKDTMPDLYNLTAGSGATNNAKRTDEQMLDTMKKLLSVTEEGFKEAKHPVSGIGSEIKSAASNAVSFFEKFGGMMP